MARKIEIEYVGDASSLSRASAQAQKSTGKLGSSFSKLGKYAKAGAIALGAVVAVGAYKAVDAASDLNEALNKSNVVFGEQAKAVEKWSRTTATSFGVSQRAALEATAGFGGMFKAAGQAGGEAAKMSQNFVKAAADLGSFFNVDPTQALEDLRSGLAGESEPLRKFNIFMNEAQTAAYAYKNGIAKTGTELTENQKILARQGFILEHIGKASNDFAETSGGLANQQRILKAQLEDTAARIGQKLLPAVTFLLTKFNELLTWSQQHWPQFQEAIRNAIDRVRPLFQQLVNYWTGTLMPSIVAVVDLAKRFWGKFGSDITRNFKNIVSVIRNAMNVVKGIIELVLAVLRGDWSAAWKALKLIAVNALQGLLTFLKNMVGNVLSIARHIGGALKDGIVAGLRGLAELVGAAARAAINAVISAFNALGDFTIPVPLAPDIHVNFPDIPQVASGGHVGRTGLAVIHKGEDVIPANVGGAPSGRGRFLVLTDADGVRFLQGLNAAYARGTGGRAIW